LSIIYKSVLFESNISKHFLMSSVFERLKNIFEWENIKILSLKIYEWSETALETIFGRISYEPIKELLTNPWFWIILIILLILGLIFRRR